MGLIFISLLLLVFGAFMFLTSVNYAWVLWEKERVDTLTKQIKPNEEDDLFRRNQVREYTQSFDIRNMSKSGVSKAQRAYEKTMVAISDGNYPSWISRAVEIFNQLRKDFVSSIRSFVSYLLHLAKPDEEEQTVEYQDEAEEREVQQTIDRVKDTSSIEREEDEQKILAHDDETEVEEDEAGQIDDSEEKFQVSPASPIRVTLNSPTKDDDEATIGLSGGSGKQNNAAFEKLEARILDKLKQSGLNHYAIWIELGELYIKFEEREKASEVFALVLKNTKNEKEKEIARNRLIGL